MFYKKNYVSSDPKNGIKYTIIILDKQNCCNLYFYLCFHVIPPELLYCVHSILFGVSTIWITQIYSVLQADTKNRIIKSTYNQKLLSCKFLFLALEKCVFTPPLS
jgi:hypothetical protein